MLLPEAENEGTCRNVEGHVMIPVSSIRVMLVDDQHAMRTLTRRSLQHLGFDEIYDLADPVEALQIARDKRIHLIMSDYNMGNMNGFEFLNAVRSDPIIGKVAFIMLSGASDRETVEKAAALGANSFVVKPFTLDGLQERIEHVLGKLTGLRVRSKGTRMAQ